MVGVGWSARGFKAPISSSQPYPQSLPQKVPLPPLRSRFSRFSSTNYKMIIRQPTRALPTLKSIPFRCQVRCLHRRIEAPPTPSPTPFIPDAQTFLTVIGRGLSAHAQKFETWDQLFTLTSPQLKEMGVEPARSRRYLLQWREKFRLGFYGIGGDLKHVKDGVGELRVVEAPLPKDWANKAKQLATVNSSSGMGKIVVNVPTGKAAPAEPLTKVQPVKGVKIAGSHTICGPHIEPLAGTQGWGAYIKVKEGLWEQKRGRKIDGGERRKAEVRAKRRAEENKMKR